MHPLIKLGIFLLNTVACIGLLILLSPPVAMACNEAVCASVVSKCMLTQSCKCELGPNCTCCQECFTCLSYLFEDCCSCVDMCPKTNETHSLSSKSNVEKFDDPVPELFQMLTSEPDPLGRWKSLTFPVEVDTTPYLPKLDTNINDNTHPQRNIIILNCTVAYMSQCRSLNKCRSSCQSTGASKYRWFHDGCCQCIGDNCVGYGHEKSLCDECPPKKEENLDPEALYYDEEINDNVQQHIAATSHNF